VKKPLKRNSLNFAEDLDLASAQWISSRISD